MHGRGAKSPLWSNYQVTTTSKKFTILSKKCPKSGPKPDQTLIDFPNGTNTSACFEQFFSKLFFLVFQIYTVQFHLSTPHMPLLKITKNPYKRTNERTHVTSSFRLAHERKGASRNNGITQSQSGIITFNQRNNSTPSNAEKSFPKVIQKR